MTMQSQHGMGGVTHCRRSVLSSQGNQIARVILSCRLSSLEELSGMEVLASDKTGTLTLNR